MPNWCNNDLHVTGDKESIKKFRLAAKGPTQTYNDFREEGSKWPEKLDSIRLKAMAEQLPDPGPVTEFSFHALFPVPDEVRRFPYDCNQANKIREKLGLEKQGGGYSWESENWGCKWGASEAALWSSEDTALHYGFDTPWGPPEPFIEKISKDWPELHFELHYEEPGMNFKGEFHVQDGSVLVDFSEECEHENEDDDE